MTTPNMIFPVHLKSGEVVDTAMVEKVIAETIDTVKAAAVAQGIIPEQQAADSWVISFDDIAHIPDISTMSDEDFFALRDTYSRYVYSKLFLRDNNGKLSDDSVATLTDIVRRYDTEGEAMVENCYRASIVAAVAGGASLHTSAGVAASNFVIAMTGSAMFANMAVVGLIFTAAFGRFKFGDKMLDMLDLKIFSNYKPKVDKKKALPRASAPCIKKVRTHETLSGAQLVELLEQATAEEQQQLKAILGAGNEKITPIQLAKLICDEGKEKSYLWMVFKTAEIIKVPYSKFYTDNILKIDGVNVKNNFFTESSTCVSDLLCKRELAILNHLIKENYEKMKPDDRAKFEAKIKEIAIENGKDLIGVGAAATAMLMAELGGFATFTLMSTVLSTLSMGLLPFGAYTAMSSVLGTVLGPIGWGVLGVFALAKIAEPNMKKVVPLVVSVAMIRLRTTLTR